MARFLVTRQLLVDSSFERVSGQAPLFSFLPRLAPFYPPLQEGRQALPPHLTIQADPQRVSCQTHWLQDHLCASLFPCFCGAPDFTPWPAKTLLAALRVSRFPGLTPHGDFKPRESFY